MRQNSFELDLEPVISCGSLGSITVIRPQPRTPSQNPDSCTMQNTPLAEENDLYIDHSTPSDSSEACASPGKTKVESPHTHHSTLKAEEDTGTPSYSANLNNGTDKFDGKNNSVDVAHISPVDEKVCGNSVTEAGNEQRELLQQREVAATSSTESTSRKQQGAPSEQSEQGSTSSNPVSEGDSGIDPCAEGLEEGVRSGLENVELNAAGAGRTAPEGLANSSEASSKKELQHKQKGESLV